MVLLRAVDEKRQGPLLDYVKPGRRISRTARIYSAQTARQLAGKIGALFSDKLRFSWPPGDFRNLPERPTAPHLTPTVGELQTIPHR
jgi:hypothetical protein